MIYISDISTTAPQDERIATEKKVYQIFDKLKIPYERVDNDVVETMEECKEIDEVLGTQIRKSIFLCNKKKTSFFLIVMPADKPLDTAAFGNKIGISHLSFAAEQYMEEHLGCKPGPEHWCGVITVNQPGIICRKP